MTTALASAPAADPPLVARARLHAERTAVVAPDGTVGYAELLVRSASAAGVLLGGASDLAGARVAFLVPPSAAWVTTAFAVWRAGGMAVPLGLHSPAPELAYVLRDAEATIAVAHPDLAARLAPVAVAAGCRFLTTAELAAGQGDAMLPRIGADRPALLLYTSGTTSTPKGVVTTHAILAAQIRAIVTAWEWRADDRILHVLPLHHLHGILNALACALWAGAACEILPAFDADAVWERIVRRDGLTLFMGVPTMYQRLLAVWDAASPERRAAMRAASEALRLMVSGSAALPAVTLARWREASGHVLLERYGMTEVGMALGNPLHGTRRAGMVGTPFPDVEVRIVGDDGAPVDAGAPGELQVRGPAVFAGYWRREEATRAAFTADGWFRTGDVAVVEDGSYRLLGRASIDIIKTGGFKVSALEIEEVLRTHPAIAEVAVVGVEDAEWGQRVAAAVVLVPRGSLELAALRAWAKERLAPYKVPSVLHLVAALPRNAMGKVLKPEVARLVTAT